MPRSASIFSAQGSVVGLPYSSWLNHRHRHRGAARVGDGADGLAVDGAGDGDGRGVGGAGRAHHPGAGRAASSDRGGGAHAAAGAGDDGDGAGELHAAKASAGPEPARGHRGRTQFTMTTAVLSASAKQISARGTARRGGRHDRSRGRNRIAVIVPTITRAPEVGSAQPGGLRPRRVGSRPP